MQAIKKFILREIIFAAILGALAYILFQTILKAYYLPVFWIILTVVVALTAIFHYSVIQIHTGETSKFTTRFMMVTAVKMMIYLVSLVIYVFSFPEKAVNFLISFFILYILYTFFEVYVIVRYLKKK